MKTTIFFSLSALCLFSLVPLAPAQTVSTTLSVVIGSRTDSASSTNYSVSATGKSDQNLQQVELLITNVTDSKKATTTTTSATTLRTGKQKTVGQVTAMLAGVFQKFLGGAAPGTSLGALGSLEKGGEVDFVVGSPDTLRFDFKTPGQPVSSHVFSKADASVFLEILTGK